MSGCLPRPRGLPLVPNPWTAGRWLGHQLPRAQLRLQQVQPWDVHVVRAERPLPPQGRQLRGMRTPGRHALSDTGLVGHQGHGGGEGRRVSGDGPKTRTHLPQVQAARELQPARLRGHRQRDHRRLQCAFDAGRQDRICPWGRDDSQAHWLP
jgi:hypothetical protein